jgi:hypothetical protein
MKYAGKLYHIMEDIKIDAKVTKEWYGKELSLEELQC